MPPFSLALVFWLPYGLIFVLNRSAAYTETKAASYRADCQQSHELECLQAGCVWQASREAPWCYYESSRFDCLPENAEANQAACLARKCVWDSKPGLSTVPWCFYDLPKALIDCHPDKKANQQNCGQRGCLWAPKAATQKHMPWCFFRGDSDLQDFAGYDLESSSRSGNAHRLIGTLKRRKTPTIYGNDIETVQLQVTPVTNNHVRITISPGGQEHFSHAPEINSYLSHPHDTSSLRYRVHVTNKPFGFAVQRFDTNHTVFDTRSLPGLTFAKQYVQLSSYLGTKNMYGLGETANPHFRRNLTWGDNIGLFSRDIGPMPELGVEQQQNLYGVHPFYLGVEAGGKSHGVYWNNMHALNIVLQPDPDVITYRSIGGPIDLHIFVGDSPTEVVSSYISMIGKPYLPPYWGLGFQLSRYGYKDLNDVKTAYKRNHDIGIPQDIQYIDIDYMHEKLDFTFDPESFAGLKEFVDELHLKNVHLVPITDPGIASRRSDYEVYDRGLDLDVYIKNSTGQDLEGEVWPGITVYPDFTHPNAIKYWLTELKKFHARVPFDGMWYDMNEVSSFVPGSLLGCPENPTLNHPPFIPILDDPIFTKTICMDAISYGGKRQYEMHSLYGYDETRVSHEAHLQLFPGKRPFLLSRSTAPGSGVHTAHWSGDVFSLWETLTYSIVNMLEFTMYGIAWTGSDICGFNGQTTEQLCVRWSQLGAFYPFSRNHNAIGQRDQDPAVWSASSQKAIREALMIRYKYLPFLYSLVVKSSLSTTDTVARPLFFNFPQDAKTYGIDSQFMLGAGIMVAPVISKDNQARIYFPSGRWYGLELSNETIDSPEGGIYKDYVYQMDQFGLFTLGGSILPWQTPALTTTESRKNPFGLLVSFGLYNEAHGELFIDDGLSTASYDQATFGTHKHFKFSSDYVCESGQGYIKITKVKDTYDATVPLLEHVQLKGLTKKPTEFVIDGVSVIPDTKVTIMPNLWIDLQDLGIAFASKEETTITWK